MAGDGGERCGAENEADRTRYEADCVVQVPGCRSCCPARYLQGVVSSLIVVVATSAMKEKRQVMVATAITPMGGGVGGGRAGGAGEVDDTEVDGLVNANSRSSMRGKLADRYIPYRSSSSHDKLSIGLLHRDPR